MVSLCLRRSRYGEVQFLGQAAPGGWALQQRDQNMLCHQDAKIDAQLHAAMVAVEVPAEHVRYFSRKQEQLVVGSEPGSVFRRDMFVSEHCGVEIRSA